MPGPKMITRVAAYGLVTDLDRILLCRISNQLPRLAGLWTLPGGGLQFREDPQDAMIREVQEETGLSVRSTGLVGVDSNSVDTEEAHYHAIRIIYGAERIGGTLTNEIDGTTDLCQFWSRADLAALPLVDLAEIGVALAWADNTKR